MDVFKELVILADRLDRKGLNKEADFLDQILQKYAAKTSKKNDDKKTEKSEKKPSKKELDKDGDGDNDFRDVMISRMQAGGVSKDKALKSTKKFDEKKKKTNSWMG